MEQLIKAICAHPYDFQPEDFRHCGLAALVRAAQTVSPVPETDLDRDHLVFVSKIERLTAQHA